MCAGYAGYHVKHFIFEGHRSKAPREELVVLTQDQLLVADPFLEKANETLKRRFPGKNPFVNSLLRRNYYQVAWSDACYAVSSIDRNGLVEGGTAWAVQLFLDRFDGGVCDAFVYDQKTSRWFCWDGPLGWSEIIEPPTPARVWAGVGSRDLKENGKQAIRSLLGYVKPEVFLR
jgi:hypothetical protein